MSRLEIVGLRRRPLPLPLPPRPRPQRQGGRGVPAQGARVPPGAHRPAGHQGAPGALSESHEAQFPDAAGGHPAALGGGPLDGGSADRRLGGAPRGLPGAFRAERRGLGGLSAGAAGAALAGAAQPEPRAAAHGEVLRGPRAA